MLPLGVFEVIHYGTPLLNQLELRWNKVAASPFGEKAHQDFTSLGFALFGV